ncbi:uncharacterized protein M6B38_312585 [Iris pallida]|uniref:Uncharacterized protein n=1 Tax=Iris pallida TaxID=29817 RepID=A0AAX6HHM9_IRIPA|nr:uncharacterized protein M6B38_312585 [Iris pallida]
MSSVDHKYPQLTTNVLCDPKSCTKSSSTCSSFLIMLLGPSCPLHSFARYQELPWSPYRGIVLGIPNQTYYPYLKPRYAKDNKSTNSLPVGQTSKIPKIQYKHNR